MKGIDTIEFYVGDSDKYIAVVESSMPPAVGEFVNIKGKSYEVKFRSFCVDHSEHWERTAMRCAVTLKRAKSADPTNGDV